MQKVRVSIIIPIYNSEKFLYKCISSVLAQSFEDYELLLINDGSKDRSAEICENLARKDQRIRVFHKENGGVSTARNLGLDHAKGEFVCFVDSDDTVSNTYLEDFFSESLFSNQIIIQEILKKDSGKYLVSKSYSYDVFKTNNFVRILEHNQILSNGYPFSKLYNMNLIKKHFIRFDENIPYCEDLLFYLTYLQYTDSLMFINKANYYYEINEHSATAKIYSYETYQTLLIELNKKLEILADNNLINDLLQVRHIRGMISFLSLESIYSKKNNLKKSERLEKLNDLRKSESINDIEEYAKSRTTWPIEKILLSQYMRRNYRTFDILFFFYKTAYENILNFKRN